MRDSDITESDPLYWSRVIMQSTGIACFKWVDPALWSGGRDALLNHVRGHEGFRVNRGREAAASNASEVDVTQALLCEAVDIMQSSFMKMYRSSPCFQLMCIFTEPPLTLQGLIFASLFSLIFLYLVHICSKRNSTTVDWTSVQDEL